MKPLVWLLPGQSSRDPQMFDRLAAVGGEGSWGGPPRPPISNRDVQLAVLGATLAWAGIARREGLHPVASAGHSLGEYAHLTVEGALTEEDVLTLVSARGDAYDAGPDGAMAAVAPLGAADVHLPRGVWVACDNAPTRVVLGGEREALEATLARLEEEQFAHTTIIEPRIPMHTPRFAPVGPVLRDALERARWRPIRTYWSNVVGAPVDDPRRDQIVDLLVQHVSHPVRWRSLVDSLLERFPDAVFLEVGPRRVLTDLLRRSRPEVAAFAIDPGGDPSDAAARFESTVAEVRRACA